MQAIGSIFNVQEAFVALQHNPILIILYLLVLAFVGYLVLVLKQPDKMPHFKKKTEVVPESKMATISRQINAFDVKIKELQDSHRQIKGILNILHRDNCLFKIYIPDLVIEYRFEAALEYFNLGGNGAAAEAVVSAAISRPDGRHRWFKSCDDYIKSNEVTQHFKDQVAWIARRLN